MLFQFKNVHKSFGAQKIFRSLNFDLERGTFSILTGASGSGKTTLFKMLCAIEAPTSGEVIFLGKRLVQHSPAHLKNIGFVFQNPRGMLDKNVFDNIALPLRIDGCGENLVRTRVFEWLDKLALRHRAQSLYSELSGGEIQKVEFARALIRKPRLILADEPTAHLDPIQSDLLLDILWEHYKDGATVFISTHHAPAFHHPSIIRYHMEDYRLRQLEPEEISMPQFSGSLFKSAMKEKST
ncbi:MAG: cell division ATP-binding protein FtsE [Bdellovibrionota bacterium]